MPIKELPDDVRDHPSLKDFNDLGALAKSHIETKAFVGNSIRPPSPDAGPEAKKDFYDKLQKHAPNLVPLPDDKDEAGQKALWSKLGVPDDAKGYEFQPPEGVELDVEKLRAEGKALGLTKKQFATYASKTAEERKNFIAEAKKDNDALKAEWGQAYDSKLKAAVSAATKLKVSEDVIKRIQSGTMPSSALKTWDSIATALGAEPNNSQRNDGSGGGAMTPAEAERQMTEIQNNPDYFNRHAPDHERLKARFVELVKLTPAGKDD